MLKTILTIMTTITLIWLAHPATPHPAVTDPPPCMECLVNHHRALRSGGKLSPLRTHPQLAAAAAAHNQYMAPRGLLCHDCPGEPILYDRLRLAGYNPNWWNEIVAAGRFYTPQDVLNLWLNSPTHLDIILSDRLTEIGCDIHYGPNAVNWYTCDLAAPRHPTPTPLTRPPMPTPSPLPTPSPPPRRLRYFVWVFSDAPEDIQAAFDQWATTNPPGLRIITYP